MTTTNDYTPSTALTAYFRSRTDRPVARHWATDSLLHNLKEIGLIDFFEGSGNDPTGLSGYAPNKIWLRTPSGVTDAPATFRRWDRVNSASSLSSWPVVSEGQYLNTNFRGAYASLAALQAAVTTGYSGEWAILTHGSGQPPTLAVWDDDETVDAWVDIGTGLGAVDWSNITSKPDATTTAVGLVELATPAEISSGTPSSVDIRIIPNVKELRAYIDPLFAALTASGVTLTARLYDYATRTAMEAATIDSGVSFVRTAGYAAVGDGGAALYKRVGSSSTPSSRYHQSADGAWWELVVTGAINPQQVGAKGDGSTDDTTAFGNASAIANALGVFVDGQGATYKLTGAGISGSSAPCKLRNTSFNITSVTTTTPIGGSFSVATGVYIEGGTMFDAGYAPASTTSGTIARGATSVTVANGSLFTTGDVVLLHAAEAWGAATTAYKSEAHIVQAVVSNTVYFEAPVEGNYNSGAVAAKVIKYPTVDIDWDNVSVTGVGSPTLQAGLIFLHCRRVNLRRVSVTSCWYTGIGVWNCFELDADGLQAERCDKAGLGYGLNVVGTNSVLVGQMVSRNCRHGITSGGGLSVGSSGMPLNRRIVIDELIGYGNTDAIFDAHPGVQRLAIGRCIATFQVDNATSGDGFTWQGQDLQIGTLQLDGFRRHGLIIQPYGSGDGIEASISIGSLDAKSTSSVTTSYGFAYDDATAVGAYNLKSLYIGHISTITKDGCLITTSQNDIKMLTIGGGHIENTGSASHGLQLLNSANGRILYATLTGLHVQMNTTAAGIYAINVTGVSGATINKCRLVGCSSVAGQYGLAASHATVDLVSYESSSHGTGSTTAGTGGIINVYS